MPQFIVASFGNPLPSNRVMNPDVSKDKARELSKMCIEMFGEDEVKGFYVVRDQDHAHEDDIVLDRLDGTFQGQAASKSSSSSTTTSRPAVNKNFLEDLPTVASW